jgi:ParB family transcriptional regulator, chromosome partitioning protein
MKRTDSQYIPLNKLKKSPRNVRQVPHSKQHIEALAMSIQTHGPLQDPVVETERDDDGQPTGRYLVSVGEGRRLAHLMRVKRRWIKSDHLVRCTVDDEHNPLALSLAENVLHESMHPADQFVAFKALVDSGQSVEDVAAQYSVTPLVVQRRLKLANVAPAFITMYREGKEGLTLEHLMALAVVDDHERQERVWNELPQGRRSAEALRTALTQDEVPMSDPVARFVTRKAYEHAGGAVRRDLFADESDVYLVDRALLERLAQKKLEKRAAKLTAEGFAWVEAWLRMDYAKRSTYGYVRTVRREPTEDESQKLAVARNRLDEVEKQMEQTEDEVKLSELDDAAANVQEQIDQLEETLEVADPEQQEISGAIVTIGRDGRVEIERGRLKPEDANRFRRSTRAGAQHEAVAGAPRTHSVAMTRRLTAHRTLALQASLAQQPHIALLALTHRLVLKELYGHDVGVRSSLQLRAEPVPLQQDAPDLEQTKACAVLHAHREKLRAQLPEPQALFGWLRTQPTETLLELLAFCIAQAVSGVQSDDSASAFDELAAAAQLDMREWWMPTAAGYFSSLPKAEILKIVRDATSADAAKPLELLKKVNLANSAEEKVAGSGWLPVVLRSHAA